MKPRAKKNLELRSRNVQKLSADNRSMACHEVILDFDSNTFSVFSGPKTIDIFTPTGNWALGAGPGCFLASIRKSGKDAGLKLT